MPIRSVFDAVLITEYDGNVKASELKRMLIRQVAKVTDGTKHWIVTYKGRSTTIPRHPSQEIRTGTYHSILKELGITGK
jgi:mRNA interferase HicA